METYVRGLKPGIIINERSIDHHGTGEYHLHRPGDGDYTTPEGYYPSSPSPSEMMETCDNVSQKWGYTYWDTNFKSSTQLARSLIHTTSVDSNFLLNIGPTDTGTISPGHANAMRGINSWTAKNGAAVYGAGYSALTGRPGWGRITRKANKLYLHVYNWPGADSPVHVSALSPFSVSAARVLGSSQHVAVRASGDGFDFTPSGSATNPIATVIEADITTPAPAPVGTGTGLKAEFWNNNTFTGTPAVTRTDAGVNYLWRYEGSPAPTIGTDNFSSRWTGTIQPRHSETYSFTTISDDTIRLWVNGQLVIDNTTPHGPAWNQGSIRLTAGQHYAIRLEQTENGGEAAAKLIWTSPNTPKQRVPHSQLYPPGTANLALNRPATQSSTGYTAPASRAVDGSTNGNFWAGSVTHTSQTPLDTNPWWQVDLGTSQQISSIKLWNRTDCCADRLRDYYVFASNTPFTSTDPETTKNQSGVWSSYQANAASQTQTLPVSRDARYIRVQLVGSDRPLSLAEVQVIG